MVSVENRIAIFPAHFGRILTGVCALLLFLLRLPVQAQEPAQTPAQNPPVSAGTPAKTPSKDMVPSEPDPDAPVTMFPHSETSRYWISGQANFIFQAHPAFHAPYSGINSLRSAGEHATSRVLTLSLGLQLNNRTSLLCDVEETGGQGIGDTLGVAGFTNLDVVRNPSLSKAPYVARLMLHHIIPLSRERVHASRGPLSLQADLSARRLEIRLGKFSVADFFDANTFGSDSHLQFMNWTVDNNGAYDYAADTRGYTAGAIVEYQDRMWGVRFAEGLMPKVANGSHLDANLLRARSENIEVEIRRGFLRKREGVVRLLSFVNHANMGVYRVAVADFLAGRTPVPDITAHPQQTTIKYGFGMNVEQSLSGWLGVFARWGWNEGQHESYVYTEVDQTMLTGLRVLGSPWRRKLDRAGVAFVSNGISRDHQQYLALGGHGFLLGDGKLTYARENIVESYYTLHLWRGIYPSVGLQHIDNPGYNRDRGPVWVPTLRLHLEL